MRGLIPLSHVWRLTGAAWNEKEVLYMWITETKNSKGTRYVYRERFTDENGKTYSIAVTLAKHTKQAEGQARRMLLKKYNVKRMAKPKRAETIAKTLTMRQLLGEWLDSVKSEVKPQTQQNHINQVRKILSLLPDGILFRDVTPALVERAIKSMNANSRGYCNAVLGIIKNSMRYAKKAHYIDNINEFLEIRLPRRPMTMEEEGKTANKFLERDELKDCLHQLVAINERIGYAMEFISLTGLRIGELLALRREDIDLKKKEIHVNGTITRVEYEELPTRRSTPKNATSCRTVAINSRAVSILEWFITDDKRKSLWTDGYKDKGYIFTGRSGSPYDYNTIESTLKKVRVNGKHITSHIFRHTHISMLVEENFPLKTIMARVGHSNPQTTMKIYTHVTSKMKEKEREALEKLTI